MKSSLEIGVERGLERRESQVLENKLDPLKDEKVKGESTGDRIEPLLEIRPGN